MKKKILFYVLISATMTILFVGCYYDNEEVLYPSLANQCDTTSVTYSKNITRLLSLYCYTCHGSTYKATGNGIQLESYTVLVKNLDRVIGAINHDPKYSEMPKNAGKITNCNIRQFEIWKENGALNN